MELLKAHINSFGKLQNIDIDFRTGINTIFKENGYGKTTLTIFLKSMFYGMAKKGNNKAYNVERSKYAPWSNGNYGGSLTIKIKDKVFTIVRQFASTPEGDTFQLIDEQTGLISNEYTKDIGVELFGVGVETFEITAFFAQDGIIAGVNDEVRANLTGANKFENDLSACTVAQNKISIAIRQAKALLPKNVEIEQVKKSIKETEYLQQENRDLIKQIQNELEQTKQNYSQLQAKQEEAKKIYQAELASKEKTKIIQQELDNDYLEYEKLNKEKIALLHQLKSEIPVQKPQVSKVGLLISALVLFVGLSALIASFFTSTKSLLLTVGIVFIVISLVAFGFLFIKRAGAQENFKLSDRENIEKQVKIAQIDELLKNLDKKIEINKDSIKQFVKHDNSEDYEKLLNELYALDKKKSILSMQLTNTQLEYQRGGERLTLLLEEEQKLLENKQNITKRLMLLEKVKEYLEKAKDNVSERYLKPMQESFNELFAHFDDNTKLMLDINLDVNQMTEVGLKESNYLSQGYKDILSFCRRFALLDQVFLKEKPFIILDDPFVNLDDEKLKVALTLVSRFAEKYQIVYICSHSRCII